MLDKAFAYGINILITLGGKCLF